MKCQWIYVLLFAPALAVAQHPYVERAPTPPRPSRQQVGDEVPPPLRLLPQARYSHKTSRGSVYVLPKDRMPCLVPDLALSKNMPNARPGNPGPMPNVYPKSEVIPRKKPGKAEGE